MARAHPVHRQRGAAPSSSATIAHGHHDLSWPAGEDSGANRLLEPSRAGTCPIWTAAAPANGWWTTPRPITYAPGCHGSRGGWSELSLGRIIAHSGNGGAGQCPTTRRLAGRRLRSHTDGWSRRMRADPKLAAQHNRGALAWCEACKAPRWTLLRPWPKTQSRQQLGQALESKRTTTRRPSPMASMRNKAVQCHTDAMCAQARQTHRQRQRPELKKPMAALLGRPHEKNCCQPLRTLTRLSQRHSSRPPPSACSVAKTRQHGRARAMCNRTAGHTPSSVSGQTTSLRHPRRWHQGHRRQWRLEPRAHRCATDLGRSRHHGAKHHR